MYSYAWAYSSTIHVVHDTCAPSHTLSLHPPPYAHELVVEPTRADDTGGLSRKKLLYRLVAYLRQGNTKTQALGRLKASIGGGPDDAKP